MNEDRCRKNHLEFMGHLKREGFHILNFEGNDYYDFIHVQYEYCDGLEPIVLGWIFSTIVISLDGQFITVNQNRVVLYNYQLMI
jgi:hypothetical protein